MIPPGLIVNWFGLVLVSLRRPRRPASYASFTTASAPGLAGFVWVSSHSRIVICPCQGRLSAIQLMRTARSPPRFVRSKRGRITLATPDSPTPIPDPRPPIPRP
jgi:hypothetical protein